MHQLGHFFNATNAFADADFTSTLDGNAGAVVSAVFEPSQSFDQKIGSGAEADITYDSTHSGAPSRDCGRNETLRMLTGKKSGQAEPVAAGKRSAGIGLESPANTDAHTG